MPGGKTGESSMTAPKESISRSIGEYNADYILETFRMSDEDRKFFRDLILSGMVPKDEMQKLIGIASTAAAHDWMSFIQCCLSIRNQKIGRDSGINGLLYCIEKVQNDEEVPDILALQNPSLEVPRQAFSREESDAEAVSPPRRSQRQAATRHSTEAVERHQLLLPATAYNQPATIQPANTRSKRRLKAAGKKDGGNQDTEAAHQHPMSSDSKSMHKATTESPYFSGKLEDDSLGLAKSQTARLEATIAQPIIGAPGFGRSAGNVDSGGRGSSSHTARVGASVHDRTAPKNIPYAPIIPDPDWEVANNGMTKDAVAGRATHYYYYPPTGVEEPSPGGMLSRKQKSKRPATSPYFNTSTAAAAAAAAVSTSNGEKNNTGALPLPPPTTASPKKPSRPARGTVSALPFPPLSASSFGLVQEHLTHNTFQLLIATTFLVRTHGKMAIPVFQSLMARYPTPATLAAADSADILAMIQHLGLGNVRCAAIQSYARDWLDRPPDAKVRYAVRNYPRPGDARDVRAGEEFGPEDELGWPGDDSAGAGASASSSRTSIGKMPVAVAAASRGQETAWEIGHLTQGPYAIDSWRIFCRDVFLGRADDWMGSGRDEKFQPEWMRVLPQDKELRACLRWMWMREGWEWDPATGKLEVLREEMRRAVNEGRVGYDIKGELRILDNNDDGGGSSGGRGSGGGVNDSGPVI